MPKRVSLPHIDALDGLRGVAVVAVMLFHSDLLQGGFLGVDLFFVLSGFLITSLLLNESRSTGTIALGAFWARRARRLLPALVLMIVGVLAYAAFAADPTQIAGIRSDALATLGYFANWRLVFAHRSYFDLFITQSPLEHTWSLAIEEQFYLVWPLVVLGVGRIVRGRGLPRAILVVALVLGAGSTALMALLYDPLRTARVYFGTDTRAAALFAGIAVAASIASWGHVRGRAGRALLEIGALGAWGGLAFLWLHVTGESGRLYRGGFLAAALGGAVIVAATVHPRPGPIAFALRFRPLCLLGTISYGLYLWHWPVDVFLDEDRTGMHGWRLFAVRSAVAIAIATASFVLVERPIRRGAWSARRWRWLTPIVAIVLVFGILVVTADAGLPSDDTGRAQPGGVLVVGDSVARSIAPGLDRAGFDVTNDGINGCQLLRGTMKGPRLSIEHCDWRSRWRAEVRALEPKTVVLVQGAFELFDIRPPGSPTVFVPGTLFWANYYKAMLEQAVDILAAGGARVVIPLIPCFGSIPGAPISEQKGSLDVERVRAANRVIDLVASLDRRVVAPDLFTFVCPKGRYQGDIGGVTGVRHDGVHFSAEGSDLVARFLAPTLHAAMNEKPTSPPPVTRPAGP